MPSQGKNKTAIKQLLVEKWRLSFLQQSVSQEQ